MEATASASVYKSNKISRHGLTNNAGRNKRERTNLWQIFSFVSNSPVFILDSFFTKLPSLLVMNN